MKIISTAAHYKVTKNKTKSTVAHYIMTKNKINSRIITKDIIIMVHDCNHPQLIKKKHVSVSQSHRDKIVIIFAILC